ncbi:MAG: hypothetical protein ABS939_23035, partial [Psychrobacillus sp.]
MGTNIVDDTVISLGDSLVLKYVKHDVDMEIRMVGYTYDGYANRYITVQLGDAKQSYVGNVQNTVREIETNVNNNVKQTVNQILNANGERMIYSVTEPVGNFKNGDVWFDQQGGMYLWDEESGMWIDHPYNRNMRVMEDEVNTAIETAESAKALAISEADSALAQAKADATIKANAIKEEVGTSVNTAISTAESAKQTAIDNYNNAIAEAARLDGEQTTAFDVKFGNIQNSVDTFNQSVSDVDAKADDALAKAGANANLLNTHQNTLDTINTITLPDIASSAETALADAKSAMDEAKLTDDKIANFVTTNGLVSGITVDTKINEATGEISKKITSVEGKVDGLQVGGRNLILDSGKEISNNAYILRQYKISDTNLIEIGENYTIYIAGELGEGQNGWYLNLEHRGSDGKFSYTGMIALYEDSKVGKNVWMKTFKMPSAINVDNLTGNTNLYTYPLGDGKMSKISKIKLVKGNMPITDWTPAPEDNYTQSEFAIFESTYNEDVKGINSTLTELSTKKVDGTTYQNFYENEYKKTAQGVTDTYAKVNKIIDANGNSTDTFAKAVYDKNAHRQTESFKEVTKDLVTTATYTEGVKGLNREITTVKGKINDLSGARNLLKESWHNSEDSPRIINGNYLVKVWDLTEPLKLGQSYTFRVFGLVNRTGFNLYTPNGAISLTGNLGSNSSEYVIKTRDTYIPTAKNRTVWEKTFTITQSLLDNMTANKVNLYHQMSSETGNAEIYWATLVEGEVGIDWSPSLTDQLGKAEFTVFKNEYEDTSSKILGRLTAIDSGKEGSFAYRLNETEITASGNTTTISNIKTKPGEQIT